MKLQLNCGSCMIKQALYTMERNNVGETEQIKILGTLIEDIPHYLNSPTPSHFQSDLLAKLSKYLSINDLYAKDREEQNAAALEIEAMVLEQVELSREPLYSAALYSVEGNSFDPIFTRNYDVKSSLKNVISHKFVIDDYVPFESKLLEANRILYICDNAGEIVFDRLFIDQCQLFRKWQSRKPAEFNIVVKSGPVLNDATVKDAVITGLNKVGNIIESGSANLGLPLELSSNEVINVLNDSDLIISKGQANFETLESESSLYGKIFFLLKAKCVHTSDYFRVPAGSSVFYFPAE